MIVYEYAEWPHGDCHAVAASKAYIFARQFRFSRDMWFEVHGRISHSRSGCCCCCHMHAVDVHTYQENVEHDENKMQQRKIAE